MLHIKQTKEIVNLIVPHSLVQPHISKSDSLSLLQSKTWSNQISPNLVRLMIWQGLAESFHIVNRDLYCRSKSNLVSVCFSKRLVDAPHVIGFVPCLQFSLPLAAQRNELFLWKGRVNQDPIMWFLTHFLCATSPESCFFVLQVGFEFAPPPLPLSLPLPFDTFWHLKTKTLQGANCSEFWISLRSEANDVKCISSTPNHFINNKCWQSQ